MNKVMLVGRFCMKPVIQKTTQGKSYCWFLLAVRRDFKDLDGSYGSDFISCIAWENLADHIASSFNKGNRIGITGAIRSRSYINTAGQRVYKTNVAIQHVDFIDPVSREVDVNQTTDSVEVDDVSVMVPPPEDDPLLFSELP